MTATKHFPLRLIAQLAPLCALLRWQYLPFTLGLPLIGAAGVSGDAWQSAPLTALLGVAVAFHVFGVLINDLVDLPLDRTHPVRCHGPLASGAIAPRGVLILAVAMIPIALSVSAGNGAGWPAYWALAGAGTGLTIYNLWGKRFFFPPLTDFIQGLGFGALALYGTFMTGPAGWTAVLVFLAVVTWTLSATLTGGLRDLGVDHRFGVITTPLWFGAVPHGTRARFPDTLRHYHFALTGLLFGIVGGILALNDVGYPSALRVLLALTVAALAWVAFRRPAQSLRVSAVEHALLLNSVRRSLAASALALLVVLTPRFRPVVLAAVAFMYLASLFIVRLTNSSRHP